VTFRSSFEIKVLASFVAAALVVLVLLGTTWQLAEEASEATQSVARTQEVLRRLAQARADTLQIEFSTQNFRITGDQLHLIERDATTQAREDTLAQIRQLTANHPGQQERLSQLRSVLNERIAISKRVEMLRKTQGVEAATAFATSAPLRETRQRTYQLLQAMDQEERSLLEIHQAAQSHARAIVTSAAVVLAGLLFALLAASYALIRRQLHAAETSRRALAESEENLSTTLHSIGDAVLATNAQGRITRMNPVAEQLTGWRWPDARGRAVDEVFVILDERTREPAEIPVAKVLATGEVQMLADHTTIVARDGRECAIADSAAPIRDAAGHIRGAVLVFRDVTLQRQTEWAIREQNLLLDRRVQQRTAQLQESEEHLRSVISNVPAMIAYVDAQRRYVYVNDQYRERFAPDATDITGRSVEEILGPARYAVAAPLIDKVLAGQAQHYDWQPFPGAWQTINYVPKQDAQDRLVGYYVLGTDITQRKQAEERIETLNAQLETRLQDLQRVDRALRTLSAGNRTMLRATSEQHLLDTMCEAIVDAGGYPIASVWYAFDDEARSLRTMAQSGYAPGLEALQKMRVTWADNERGQGAIATTIRSAQMTVAENMLVDPRYAPWRPYLQGSASCIACPLHVNGRVIGALAIFAREPHAFGPDEIPLLCESADDLAFGIATLRARAEKLKTQEAIHQLTHYDPLTGLPNATQFTEALTASLLGAATGGESIAVLQTNIERLSEINDALGFSQGDQLLKDFAARLRAASPEGATVARLRGDEFAVLIPGSQASEAIALAQRLEEALSMPFPIADIRLDVAVNTGIALFPEHGATAHDLFRHMDIAMHQAKKKGVRHNVFDPTQARDQPRRLNLAGELRRAIEGGDLLIYLQPKVDMASGQVCGSEALVRWRHAERGLLQPVEFIGLAEHTGLIKPLTEWMIDAALRLNLHWKGQGYALPIAVNLSARNLRDEDLLQKIRNRDAASGLLELEITESAVMEDAEFALRVLHSLREEGIALYIDDFGTGYSSLSYLQKLPVDCIKIDQSFVRGMSRNKDSAVIVRSTIDLVHDLGRKVVAEGIETLEDWHQLSRLGCDIAQGYFIAKPMPADDFPAWVERYRMPA